MAYSKRKARRRPKVVKGMFDQFWRCKGQPSRDHMGPLHASTLVIAEGYNPFDYLDRHAQRTGWSTFFLD